MKHSLSLCNILLLLKHLKMHTGTFLLQLPLRKSLRQGIIVKQMFLPPQCPPSVHLPLPTHLNLAHNTF